MERHGLHAMPELLGVPFALHRALAAKPPRAPPFSHEVGGPGFEYAAHELATPPVGGASGPDFAGPPRATLRFSVLLYGGQNDRRVVPWILDRATDPQPAVRPVPRSGRAVATYVL